MNTPTAARIAAALLLSSTLATAISTSESTTIAGTRWTAVPDWGQHEALTIGNTHGAIAVSPSGDIHINTDAAHGTLVHDPDGSLSRHIAERFHGMHDMQMRVEDGTPYLYGAHLPGKQVVKLRLDGTHVWTLGVPMESGKYDDDPNAYNPTAVAVAPDGRIYVADGYGRNWIHVFGPDLKYITTFGGPGAEPGQFHTCHGMAIDSGGEQPVLVICDRENRRLQRLSLDGTHIDTPVTDLRRPCSIAFWTAANGTRLIAVAELEGRVTLLDGDYTVLGHLGDNPVQSHWANNGVSKEAWKPGVTTAPHGVCFDHEGNLYVQDWNAHGRVHKFVRSAK